MNQTGIETVLLRAHDILSECGLAKNMHWNPKNGNVDVDCAVLMACGATGVNVIIEDIDKVLPPASVAKYTEALWCLDRSTEDGDVVEWADQDSVDLEAVLALIMKSVERIRIA